MKDGESTMSTDAAATDAPGSAWELPTAEVLLGLVGEPLLAAVRGRVRRDALRGRRVHIVARAPVTAPEHAAIVRRGDVMTLAQWPGARGTIQDGDHVIVQVGTDAGDRERYVRWLHDLARHELPRLSLSPCSRTAAGLHPLWCIAVARLCLPAHITIEARHDLLGIRLAQVALGFGADALGGPIHADRSLPLCGVTRPDENTVSGLATLVRHAGLQPIHESEPTP
jgi:hypothetical protein